MKHSLSMILGLSLLFSPVAMADTVVNPDGAWWATFFEVAEGTAPDFDKIALSDPEYLAADEFTRAEVLARVIDRLKAERAALDPAETEVVTAISTRLGDYSAAEGGFPVEMFGATMRLRPAFPEQSELFFRNWQDFALYRATIDEGRALRERIGTREIRADVTVGDIRVSKTRDRAFDARVLSVTYFAPDGLQLATVDAAPEAALLATEKTPMVEAVRMRLHELADIPPLGTSWQEARLQLAASYPQVASDLFIYPTGGKTLAFIAENGNVLMDAPHEADKPFNVFVQQVDGPWRLRPGFSMDMNAALGALDTKVTGPGLACLTPTILDRCAMLEFTPAPGGHVLTRAYGVVELEPAGAAQEVLASVIGENAAAFDQFSTRIAYDTEAIRLGALPKFPGNGGVEAHVASAGEERPGEPLFDPLRNTLGMKPIQRDIALFAVDGAENRVPLIFVLQ